MGFRLIKYLHQSHHLCLLLFSDVSRFSLNRQPTNTMKRTFKILVVWILISYFWCCWLCCEYLTLSSYMPPVYSDSFTYGPCYLLSIYLSSLIIITCLSHSPYLFLPPLFSYVCMYLYVFIYMFVYKYAFIYIFIDLFFIYLIYLSVYHFYFLSFSVLHIP